jgi:hypothetical protein
MENPMVVKFTPSSRVVSELHPISEKIRIKKSSQENSILKRTEPSRNNSFILARCLEANILETLRIKGPRFFLRGCPRGGKLWTGNPMVVKFTPKTLAEPEKRPL